MNTAQTVAATCDSIIAAMEREKCYHDDDVLPLVHELADQAEAIRTMAINEIGRPMLLAKAETLREAMRHLDALVDTDPYDPDADAKKAAARLFLERNVWATR